MAHIIGKQGKDYGLNIPVSADVLDAMIEINNALIDLINGFLPPYDDVNFEVETPKIRGGTLLWDIINRCALKVSRFNK
ncbi:unnamed protein product [Gongylonema pulchrum]|uniref:MT domain-containing protein n=1 Tax=Gongylonema pulchrum TaxID=637853 RepID=A0A183D8G6_9BILA|nr:unnamed protein product [Gongylonema pulchrum]